MKRLGYAALAAWMGAIGCATFVAIRSFKTFEDTQAADFMGPVFKAVDLFGIAAAICFAVALRTSKLRLGLALLIGAGAAINRFYITPKIEARVEGFMSWHRVAETTWTVILLVGLFLLVAPLPKQQKRV